MTFAWNARHRLCWPRMVWLEHNYNFPEYVMHRDYYARKPLRAYRRPLQATIRCDRSGLLLPPKIGKYPVLPRWHRPKKSKPTALKRC